MNQFTMNLEFVNVIATDSKILKEINNSEKKDKTSVCIEKIKPFLKLDLSEDIKYFPIFSKVTYVNVVESSENVLIIDLECAITIICEGSDEEVLAKIKKLEAKIGDIRNFATVYWVDKEKPEITLFDGWDEDIFEEQLEEEIEWEKPDVKKLLNM